MKRRIFLKKSFFLGLLGCFAPNLIGKTKEIGQDYPSGHKHYYIFNDMIVHEFLGLWYYSFGRYENGKIINILTIDITDDKNPLWYDNTQKGLYKWRKIKNFKYDLGYKKQNWNCGIGEIRKLRPEELNLEPPIVKLEFEIA
ncbi:MAG: hypothetical protein Q7R95_07310 [bacterium]|nr:hypothetical protein [bacterium]